MNETWDTPVFSSALKKDLFFSIDMADLDIPVLNSLEEILQNSLAMENSLRWEKYHRRGEAQEENSLQHSYKASLLAAIVIANERKYSRKDFNGELVLAATIVHDIGEIEKGDAILDYIQPERRQMAKDLLLEALKGKVQTSEITIPYTNVPLTDSFTAFQESETTILSKNDNLSFTSMYPSKPPLLELPLTIPVI